MIILLVKKKISKMNTIQLQKILEDYGKSKNFYYGVFPIDKLPSIEFYPSCLIINNQSSKQEGEHWLAIHFSNRGYCEFFDSFGKSPAFYGVLSYLKRYAKNQVQQESNPIKCFTLLWTLFYFFSYF